MADKESSGSASGGIGVLGALGLIFVVLKLVGTIDWSWWWVLLPFYGPLGLALIICLVVIVIAVGGALMKQRALNRRFRQK